MPNDSRSLNICHIVATTEGATWAFEQLRDLRDKHGHHVSVILNGDRGALVDKFRAAGIRVLTADFEFLNSSDFFVLPKKILALARMLHRERFDVVQTHLFHSMVIGRIASWIADVPVRLAMIAGPFHLEAYTPRWIDKSTQWMETALIPSCDHSRQLYRSMGVSSDRLHVIYYGPDEAQFDPDQHVAAQLRRELGWGIQTPVIGMVAYFYPELGVNRWTPPAVQGKAVKCQADLIRAMPIILRQQPEAKLVFIGSGWGEAGEAYLEKMKELTRSLGLEDAVKFLGYRKDVPSLLKALDVTVQASLSENLGGTIEALLMKCPIVVTRVGGLVDSVIDGKTGVVVKPADPEALAHGLLSQLENPGRAAQMAEAGRRFMLDHFTLRATVDKQSALYGSLRARKRQGYRRALIAYRLLLGGAVCMYLGARYWFIDLRLLPALDAGWRPWHFQRLRQKGAHLLRVSLPGPRVRMARDRLLSSARVSISWRWKNPKPRSIHRGQWLAHLLKPAITAKQRAQRSVRWPETKAVLQKPARSQIHQPPPVVPKVYAAPSPFLVSIRMAWYRLLSAIGRKKLGWGLRRKLAERLRRLFRLGR